MRPKLLEHFAGVCFVTVALLLALLVINLGSGAAEKKKIAGAERFGDLSFVDFRDRFQVALLRDVVNIYYPGRYDANDSLLGAIVRHNEKAFAEKLYSTRVEERLTASRLAELLGMYGKFLFVYIIVMALTYYGVQTLAVFRFVLKKRFSAGGPRSFGGRLKHGVAAVFAGMGTLLLFCPAYVIAYSIRTEFNTDTSVFMILLGVVSNGVLITYSNKFYAFLVAESRKGYVDTAVVKNLYSNYRLRGEGGIALSAIFMPVKQFKGHVFDHIFRNARFQYLSTIKEQASFLITGIIIIEMALNIQGHLSYEMLKQLLYKNYATVVAIILGIFYTVKITEAFADYLFHRESLRYENKES